MPAALTVRRAAIGVSCLVAWWLLSGWIARHWQLDPALVRFAIVLVVMPAITAIGCGHRPARNASWSPPVSDEQSGWRMAHSRTLSAVALGLLLLVQCVSLLSPSQNGTGWMKGDVAIWLVLGVAVGLRWQPVGAADEATLRRELLATGRGLSATLLASLAAIALDAYRGGGTLRPSREAALLAGCLTYQLNLIFKEGVAESA